MHLNTEAPPTLTCLTVLLPSKADTCLNVFVVAPLCWQAVRMARSASLKQEEQLLETDRLIDLTKLFN